MPNGDDDTAGAITNSFTFPAMSMRPILPVFPSVNHIAPSLPLVMYCESLFGVGISYSATIPLGVMRTTRLALLSTNQMFPSGPAAMPVAPLSVPGSGNSSIVPSPAPPRSDRRTL
jgi:hypothetical protein